MNTAETPWVVEKEPQSSATLTSTGAETVMQFALAAGEPHGQYVAMAAPVATSAGVDRVAFVGRAERPIRISVQFRLSGRQAQRWRHSVYLDSTPRPIVLRIADFEPADAGSSGGPIVVPLSGLMFVVDTVNVRPGSAGTIGISDVRLGIDRLREPPAPRSGP